MDIVPLGPGFGAELRGMTLADIASDDTAYAVARAAFEKHSILVLPNQNVTDEIQLAFSRRFGAPEVAHKAKAPTRLPRLRHRRHGGGIGTKADRRGDDGGNRTRRELPDRWRHGDVVMWDNRATMHRGRPWPAKSRDSGSARRCPQPKPTASPPCVHRHGARPSRKPCFDCWKEPTLLAGICNRRRRVKRRRNLRCDQERHNDRRNADKP
jgi:Taurine catabolism dioxygenase TauD, TfdA family